VEIKACGNHFFACSMKVAVLIDRQVLEMQLLTADSSSLVVEHAPNTTLGRQPLACCQHEHSTAVNTKSPATCSWTPDENSMAVASQHAAAMKIATYTNMALPCAKQSLCKQHNLSGALPLTV
jgi:hypothetical protein